MNDYIPKPIEKENLKKIHFLWITYLIFNGFLLNAQTQGPNNAGIGFTSGGGTNWSNPGYITADDNLFSTVI